jgi:hypothetical protein
VERIFAVLLAQLDTLDDPQFLEKISWLLAWPRSGFVFVMTS